MHDDEPRMLRLTAAARYAGVGRSTLHDAADRGEIPFDVILGQRAWYTDEIQEWAESRRKGEGEGARVSVPDDTERRRAYLERQVAECDRIARTARHPEARTTAAEERRELQAQLAALETTEVAA